MDDLLEYASRYDPAFPSRIEGASAEEIDRLERAAGAPLPRDYRKFLELIGRKDDDLFNSFETAHTVAAMLELYEQNRDKEEYLVPEDCIAVAVGTVSLELVCIELEPPHRVFETWAGEKGRMWAASLRGHLYKNAFLSGARRRRKRMLFFHGDANPERLPRAERFFDRLGYQRQWFSDEFEPCYESADDSVIAYRQERFTFSLVLCTDRFLLRRMHFIDSLSRAVGMRLKQQPSKPLVHLR